MAKHSPEGWKASASISVVRLSRILSGVGRELEDRLERLQIVIFK